MYERLTKYAGTLAGRETSSRFGCGTIGMDEFIDDFYGTEGFADTGYFSPLERHGVDASAGIESCDVSSTPTSTCCGRASRGACVGTVSATAALRA